ncbi:MAG: DUF3696 domain-containing protein [Planctomycetaceae bacterium]
MIEIELKPITLLYGANSAGKSSLIHALHYLFELFVNNNPNPRETVLGGESVDLGGFRQFVYEGKSTNTVSLLVEVSLADGDLSDYARGDLLKSIGIIQHFAHYEQSYTAMKSIKTLGLRVSLGCEGSDVLINCLQLHLDGRFVCEIGKGDETRWEDETSCYEGTYLKIDAFHDFWFYTNSEGLRKSWFHELTNSLWCLEDESNYYLQVNDTHFFDNCMTSDVALSFSQFLEEENLFIRYNKSSESEKKSNFDDEERFFIDVDFKRYAINYQLEEFFTQLFRGSITTVRTELSRLLYLGPLRTIPTNLEQNLDNSPATRSRADGTRLWQELFSEDAGVENDRRINYWLASNQHFDGGCEIRQKYYMELDYDLLRACRRGVPQEVTDFLVSLPMKKRIVILSTNGHTKPVTSYHEELSESLERLYHRIKGDPQLYRNILRESSHELRPQDVGVGISQLLPVLVLAFKSREALIAIEQPELHLHPRMQSELGDLFICTALEYTDEFVISDSLVGNKNSYILETHSEHLLLRILRRIREQHEGAAAPDAPKITPEDVSVLYFRKTEDGTRVDKLRINEKGEFVDRWPEGFFDEREKELF